MRTPTTRQLSLCLFLCLCLVAEGARRTAGNVRGSAGGGSGQERFHRCPPPREIEPCVCKVMSKGIDVICDNAEMNHITNTIDVLKRLKFFIYWLRIRSCNVPKIPDFIFLGLEVTHLNIIRSNVSKVDISSLSALGGSLESLDLADNKLVEVPTRAFSSLKKLTHLNLNYNQIHMIQAEAFMGLDMLERLSLYGNRIKHLEDDSFKGIGRKLQRLNVGKNQLTKIPTHTFQPLVGLEVLDIHENQIKHLPEKAFAGLIQLDVLKLENNKITEIPSNVFHDLIRLNSLNMEHNEIASISDDAFVGLESSLGFLELGNNRLDHIPSHAFRRLHNLRQLDLDTNRISDIPEDAFKGYGDTLKYILLDKNRIKSIPAVSLMDLHSLEWLKLSHNEIKSLPEDSIISIIDTLTLVDLSHNPLVCDCEILWLKKWLSNVNNVDARMAEEHVCTAEDRKVHIITALPDDLLYCPHHRRGSVFGEKYSAATCNTKQRNTMLTVPFVFSCIIYWT